MGFISKLIFYPLMLIVIVFFFFLVFRFGADLFNIYRFDTDKVQSMLVVEDPVVDFGQPVKGKIINIISAGQNKDVYVLNLLYVDGEIYSMWDSAFQQSKYVGTRNEIEFTLDTSTLSDGEHTVLLRTYAPVVEHKWITGWTYVENPSCPDGKFKIPKSHWLMDETLYSQFPCAGLMNGEDPYPTMVNNGAKFDESKIVIYVHGANNDTELVLCPELITTAYNPDDVTECQQFPTPCDVPQGWVVTGECPKPNLLQKIAKYFNELINKIIELIKRF